MCWWDAPFRWTFEVCAQTKATGPLSEPVASQAYAAIYNRPSEHTIRVGSAVVRMALRSAGFRR